MKKYIGTKEVLAQPITATEAIEAGYRVNNHNGDGYEVEYKDGYKSWSPKEVFEEAYKLAETNQDRMRIEIDELSDRLFNLDKFIDGAVFKTLDSTTQSILIAQRQYMRGYIRLLFNRIKIMEEGEVGNIGVSFSVAIELLKDGYCVRRAEWKDKGLFIIKQVPAHIDSDIIPKMTSLPQSAKDIILKGKGFIEYMNQCLICNENTGGTDSWSPSIGDVFADDWEIAK